MPALRLIGDESTDTPTSSTTAAEDGPATTAVPGTTTTAPAAETTTTTTMPATTAIPTVPAPVLVEPPGAEPASDALWLVPTEGTTTEVPVRDRRYRGVMEVGGSALGGIQLVNRLDVEEYLMGMGEVLDPGWPPAALRAQAVAARTYALRATRAGGTLCDDDRCQVYLGAGAEYRAMDEAVEASAGQVLVYGGGLAATVYSASAGGVTATPREGFGTDGSDYPYLPSAPYTASDPPVWSATVSLADLGRLLDYPGTVREARVSAAGPSGRALEVVLDGDAGPKAVDALRFASRVDLHSTLFSFRTAIGTAQAALGSPLPSGRSIQAPPDAASSLPPLLPRPAREPERPEGLDLAHAARSALTLVAAALLLVHRRRLRAARPASSPGR